MALNQIILEAPKFGAGRKCKNRPVDLAKLFEITDGDSAREAEILSEFATYLRETLCQMSAVKPRDRAKLAKSISQKADDLGAYDLARAAIAIEAAPNDAGLLAQFTKSVVSTSTFLASLNRV